MSDLKWEDIRVCDFFVERGDWTEGLLFKYSDFAFLEVSDCGWHSDGEFNSLKGVEIVKPEKEQGRLTDLWDAIDPDYVSSFKVLISSNGFEFERNFFYVEGVFYCEETKTEWCQHEFDEFQDIWSDAEFSLVINSSFIRYNLETFYTEKENVDHSLRSKV